MSASRFSGLGACTAARDRLSCESTLLYVFGLIWPKACIDCSAGEDCYLVGVSEGSVRHVVGVPCALVEFDQGLTLVRAVYKSGIPSELCCAPCSLSVSL